MKRDCFRIGLTGSPGTGKSTVAEFLAAKGAAVISGDELGRRVLREFPEVKNALRVRYGDDIFTARGVLKRRVLGRIVFSRRGEAAWLNTLMFPKIHELLERDIQKICVNHRVLVFDAAMIFEWGIEKEFDTIWVVTAPEELAQARLAGSGRLTLSEIRMRMQAQLPPEEKVRRADVIIFNTGNRKQLQQFVNRIWKSERLSRFTSQMKR